MKELSGCPPLITGAPRQATVTTRSHQETGTFGILRPSQYWPAVSLRATVFSMLTATTSGGRTMAKELRCLVSRRKRWPAVEVAASRRRHSLFKRWQEALGFTLTQVHHGGEARRGRLVPRPELIWPREGGTGRCAPSQRSSPGVAGRVLLVAGRGQLLGALVGRGRALGERGVLGGLGQLLEEVQLGPAPRGAAAAVRGHHVAAVGTRHRPQVGAPCQVVGARRGQAALPEAHPRRGDWVVQGATPGQAPVVGGLAATSEGEGAGHDRATHVDAADGRHQHRGQQDEHHRDAHCRVHGRLQVLHAGAQPLVWGPWQDTHQRVRRVGNAGQVLLAAGEQVGDPAVRLRCWVAAERARKAAAILAQHLVLTGVGSTVFGRFVRAIVTVNMSIAGISFWYAVAIATHKRLVVARASAR